ncbi:hypothetical protein OE88DRAFT_387898 [Heliocybe sulcata]|uniref:Uncharacterized protein n=1 Tax=Heliocybe sulcata TaxID=5364 RepID=A0A5C3MXU0_9AGAM|nr:hypothetical protein OE88DRAFT_387898 [Heliocybe sulcata]
MLSTAVFLLAAMSFSAASPVLEARADVHCGTTQDASLTACQSLLDNWTGNLVKDNDCTYGATGSAWNVDSVPGCSLYMTDPEKEPNAVKEALQSLLNCADKSKGTVNGLTTLADGTGVCIGGNSGCGDCFDDADFDPPSRRNVAPTFSNSTIEKRQFADIAGSIAELLDSVISQGGSDDTKRANGVRNVVDGMAKQYAPVNVVACHTDHQASFDGAQGTDWVHQHFEIDISVGGTIGYELYLGNTGTFKRNGDGGDINWGWNAALAKPAEQDGSFLTFANRH